MRLGARVHVMQLDAMLEVPQVRATGGETGESMLWQLSPPRTRVRRSGAPISGRPRLVGHACSLYNNQIIVSGGSSGTDWTHVLENVKYYKLHFVSLMKAMTRMSSVKQIQINIALIDMSCFSLS